jgi:phosphoribosyl-AMP cyclohydrolase
MQVGGANSSLALTDYPSPDFSKAELVRVITTDKKGRVLMDAYQDEKAYKTSQNGQGAYFSRTQFSRTGDGTWVKGMSSGMTQRVLQMGILSNNSVLMAVNQRGESACHDGTESCFYRRLYPDGFLRPIMKPVVDPAQMYSASRPSAVQSDTSDVSGDLSESERVSLWLLALSEKIQSRLRSGNTDSFTVREVARGVRSCFASYSSEFTELVSAIRKLQLARQNESSVSTNDAIDEAGQCYCTLLVALASKGFTLSQILCDQDTSPTETTWSDVSLLDALLRDSRPSGDLLDSICAIPYLSSSVRKNANPSEVSASARAMIQGLTGLLGNEGLPLPYVMELEQKCRDYVSLR